MPVIPCSHCNENFEVGSVPAGFTVECPYCHQPVLMPEITMAPPIPIANAGFVEAPPGQSLAIVSMVLGILSFVLFCAGPFLAPVAIILGHLARSRARRQSLGGVRGMALAGLILGYVYLALLILIAAALIGLRITSRSQMRSVFPGLSAGRDANLRSSCANNLKQMGLVCKMFAGESRSGAFPALSEVPGRLAFTTEPPEGEYGVYPEYLTDVTTLYCPLGTPVPDPMIDPLASINDQDYLYLGHAVANDAEVLSFAQAYRDAVEKGLPLSGDFDVAVGTGSGGGNQILRLKEGIERYYVTDINNPAVVGLNQSRIAAIIERPGHHKQGGGHVLFMDGHVEFIPYPGKWPMTPTTIATLLELADME